MTGGSAMRFTERRRVGFGLACIGTAFLAMAAAPAPVRGATLSPDVLPVLSTYATLSAQWWQWILGIPAASNPGLDTTGQFCGMNQSGPVWFLAGTFASEPVTLSCTVLAVRAMFFPLVYVAVLPDPVDTVDPVRRPYSSLIDGV